MTTNTRSHALPFPRSHESSHSFSLAALSARTVAPIADDMTADSSGVIDLSALRDGAVVAPAEPTLLSAAVSLVPEGHAEVLPPPSGAPRWAIATVGLLAGAVAVLGTLAVATPERTTAVRDAAAEPSMAALTALPTVTEGDTGPAASPPVNLEGALALAAPETDDVSVFQGPMPAAAGDEAPVAAKAPAKATSKSKRRTTRSKKATPKKTAARKSAKPAAPAPKAPAPKATTPKSDGLSVDCILDPSSCGRGSGTKPAAPKAKTVSLPEKLSNTALRSGLAGPKAKAKRCSATHGGTGETVRVKLSIGGSGSVLSATASAPHANALGRCVADALKTAEFAPFSKPAMGVVYSVRL